LVSMPVYGCRALCKSQYAVSTPPPAHRGSSAPQTRARGEVDVFHKPRHGFATEPMYVGVGGRQDDRLRCGQRVRFETPHTYSQQAKAY